MTLVSPDEVLSSLLMCRTVRVAASGFHLPHGYRSAGPQRQKLVNPTRAEAGGVTYDCSEEPRPPGLKDPLDTIGPDEPQPSSRLPLENGELVPKGDDLRVELEPRPEDGPKSGEQGDERGRHGGGKRYLRGGHQPQGKAIGFSVGIGAHRAD